MDLLIRVLKSFFFLSFYLYVKHIMSTTSFQKFVVSQIFFNVFERSLFFQGSLMNRKFKRKAFFEREIFCNIINVFTVTFDPDELEYNRYLIPMNASR